MPKPFAVLAFLLAAAVAAGAPVTFGSAVEKQRARVAAEPNSAGAQNDLGNLLVLTGDYEGAEQAYRKALDLDPKRAATHFNLGLLLQERGDLLAAYRRYGRTLDLQPDHAWAWYQTGTIYAKWHLKTLAVRAYSKALSLDPRLGDPHVNPHMIENPYATQAMLRSYRQHVPQAQAPTVFDDAPAIARMLIFESAPRPEAPAAKPAPPATTLSVQGSRTAPTPAPRGVAGSPARVGGAFEPAPVKPEPPAEEPNGAGEEGGYLEVRDPSEPVLPVGVPVYGVGATPPPSATPAPGGLRQPGTTPNPSLGQPTPAPTPRPFYPGTSRPGAGFDPTPTSTGQMTIELTPLAG